MGRSPAARGASAAPAPARAAARHDQDGFGDAAQRGRSTTTTLMLSSPPARLAASIERGGRGGGLAAAEEGGDLGVGQHGGEAVGAQQHPVAGQQVAGHPVDDDAALHAEGPGDDAAEGVHRRLLRGELARGDHVGHQRVVPGELRQGPVAVAGRRGCRRCGRSPRRRRRRRPGSWWCPCRPAGAGRGRCPPRRRWPPAPAPPRRPRRPPPPRRPGGWPPRRRRARPCRRPPSPGRGLRPRRRAAPRGPGRGHRASSLWPRTRPGSVAAAHRKVIASP